MTDDRDFAQLAALQTERLTTVEAAFYAAGFAVLSVTPHALGYEVRIEATTWSLPTVTSHTEKAGYALRISGTDRKGAFIIVSAKGVQK